MKHNELDFLEFKLKNNNKIFGWSIIITGSLIAVLMIIGSFKLPNLVILYIVLTMIVVAALVSIIVYFTGVRPLEKAIKATKNKKIHGNTVLVSQNNVASSEESIKKKIEKFSYVITYCTFLGILLGEIVFIFDDVIAENIAYFIFFPLIGLTIIAIIYFTANLISLEKKLKTLKQSDNFNKEENSSNTSNGNFNE